MIEVFLCYAFIKEVLMKKYIILIILVICLSGCSLSKPPENPKKEFAENKEGPFKDRLDAVWYSSSAFNRVIFNHPNESSKSNDIEIYTPEDDYTLRKYRYITTEPTVDYDRILEEIIEKKSQSGSKELHQDYVPKLVMAELGNSGMFYVKEKESDVKWSTRDFSGALEDQKNNFYELYGERGVMEHAFLYERAWLFFFSDNGDLRTLLLWKLVEMIESGFNEDFTNQERIVNLDNAQRFLASEFSDPKVARYLQHTYDISPKNLYMHISDFAKYLESNQAPINILRAMDEEEFMHFTYNNNKRMSYEESNDVYQRGQKRLYKGSHSLQDILDNLRDYRVFY